MVGLAGFEPWHLDGRDVRHPMSIPVYSRHGQGILTPLVQPLHNNTMYVSPALGTHVVWSGVSDHHHDLVIQNGTRANTGREGDRNNADHSAKMRAHVTR